MEQLLIQLQEKLTIKDDFTQDKRENEKKRVILLLDLDCYEVQVWLKRLRPELVGKNVPVVVTNQDYVILSVNYAAKRLGIKRKGKGQNFKRARQICKDHGLFLEELMTELRYGKSDSFLPVKESDRILRVIQQFQSKSSSILVNRSSNDEFYLDVSEEVEKRIKFVDNQYPTPDRNDNLPNKIKDNDGNNSWRRNKILQKLVNGKKGFTSPFYRNSPRTIVEGRDSSIPVSGFGPKSPRGLDNEFEQEKSLFYGAMIAQEIMTLIYNKLGYLSSVGVAHNKSRAKLATDLNKPEGIAILTDEGFDRLARTTFKIDDLVGFKGEKGEMLMCQMEKMKLSTFIGNVREMDRKKLVLLCQPKVNSTNTEGQGQAEKLVEDLLIKCQGIDESLVSTKVYPESMNVSTSFKGSRSATNSLISLLCEDMWSRLTYAKNFRRLQATTLTINMQLKRDLTKSKQKDENEVDVAQINQIKLKRTEVPTRQQIRFFVFSYVEYLKLNSKLHQLDKVTLTAGQFISVDFADLEKSKEPEPEDIEVEASVEVPKEVTDLMETLDDLDQVKRSRVSVLSGNRSKGGRTCLTFWIVNVLLKKMKDAKCSRPGVIFVDFDMGQSKFTPSGVISVTKVEKPLVGPDHHQGHSTPIRSIYLGQLEPISCTRMLVMGMQKLCEFLDGHDEYKDYPRVLSTQGMFSELAVYLNSRALNFFQPTHVIQLIKSGVKSKSEPVEMTAAALTQYLTGGQNCKSEFADLTQQVPLKDNVPNYQFLGLKKEVQVAPQIGMVSNIFAKMSTREQAFTKYFVNPETTRHFVSLTKTESETGTQIGIGIETGTTQDENCVYEQILQSYVGNLVALCGVPNHLIKSLPAIHYSSPKGQGVKFNLQCIENWQDISKDFYGYGFARSHRVLENGAGKLDVVMEIISPVSSTVLQSQVNFIVPANRLKFSPTLAHSLSYWGGKPKKDVNFESTNRQKRENSRTFRSRV